MPRYLCHAGAVLLMGSLAALEVVYRVLLREGVLSAAVDAEDGTLDGPTLNRVEVANLEHALSVLSGQAD
jgi:hypothetical protein